MVGARSAARARAFACRAARPSARVEAAQLILSLGSVTGLDQVEEPKRAGSEAGGRRGLGLVKLFTDPTSASIPAPASALRLDAVFQPGRGVRRTFRYG